MPVRRILPTEAPALLAVGYRYVDVRSVPEFEAGHAEGAYNVPLMHMVPGRGMTPNPDFAATVERHFARDDKLLFGCKSGGRSNRAAELIAGLGYTDVIDLRGGFDGESDASGRVTVPGWKAAGLPVTTAAPLERTWAGLLVK